MLAHPTLSFPLLLLLVAQKCPCNKAAYFLSLRHVDGVHIPKHARLEVHCTQMEGLHSCLPATRTKSIALEFRHSAPPYGLGKPPRLPSHHSSAFCPPEIKKWLALLLQPPKVSELAPHYPRQPPWPKRGMADCHTVKSNCSPGLTIPRKISFDDGLHAYLNPPPFKTGFELTIAVADSAATLSISQPNKLPAILITSNNWVNAVCAQRPHRAPPAYRHGELPHRCSRQANRPDGEYSRHVPEWGGHR